MWRSDIYHRESKKTFSEKKERGFLSLSPPGCGLATSLGAEEFLQGLETVLEHDVEDPRTRKQEPCLRFHLPCLKSATP